MEDKMIIKPLIQDSSIGLIDPIVNIVAEYYGDVDPIEIIKQNISLSTGLIPPLINIIIEYYEIVNKFILTSGNVNVLDIIDKNYANTDGTNVYFDATYDYFLNKTINVAHGWEVAIKGIYHTSFIVQYDYTCNSPGLPSGATQKSSILLGDVIVSIMKNGKVMPSVTVPNTSTSISQNNINGGFIIRLEKGDIINLFIDNRSALQIKITRLALNALVAYR